MIKMSLNKTNQKRSIPICNYVGAFVILIIIILLGLYALKWYDIKQTEKYRTSYLIDSDSVSLKINNQDELKQVFVEAPESYFIYFGFRNNVEVYQLEKNLKPIIQKYNLKDIFYYVDITDMMNKPDYLDELNRIFKLKKPRLKKVPAIIYFDQENYEIIPSKENQKLTKHDLIEILDQHDFESIIN